MEDEIAAQLQLVDDLIAEVKAVPIPAPRKGKPLPPRANRSEAKASSTLDTCWAPLVPPGHTPYSWLGEEEEEEEEVPTDVKQAPKPKGRAPQQQGQPPQGQQSKKQKQKQKGKKQPKQAAASKASETPAFARIDLRVGHVVEVFEHANPEVKSLWCEHIDVGEDKPRQIASGLRKFYAKEEFQGKKIIVVCNLKPSKLKGFESQGMVLCASNEDHTKVELVEPPPGAKPGTRISLENLDVNDFTPDAKVNPKKKKNAWKDVAPKLKTNESRVACFDGVPLVTPEGVCTVPTLGNCIVK